MKMINTNGAIFDFLGTVTTLKNPISVGSSESPQLLLDVFVQWAKDRKLNISDAYVLDWDKYIT